MSMDRLSADQIEWFEHFINMYTRGILKVLKSRVYDTVLVEDLLQDVFFKVGRNIERLENLEEPQLSFYIRRIIRSVISDYFRKEKEGPDLLEEEIDFEQLETDYHAYINPENHIMDQNIKFMIEQLPDKYKDVMSLRVCYEMDFVRIGKILGIKETTARKRFERAKKIFLEYFGEDIST